jgi:hypothetical protein
MFESVIESDGMKHSIEVILLPDDVRMSDAEWQFIFQIHQNPF